MYVEFKNNKLAQDQLYYKLNAIFSLEDNSNVKKAGIYALFDDDICLYVGKSKNLASRLATHLSGRYELIDEAFFWTIQDLGYLDFSSYDEAKQDAILDNAEQYLMSVLHPTENLLIDHKKKFTEIPTFFSKETNEEYISTNNKTICLTQDTIYYFNHDVKLQKLLQVELNTFKHTVFKKKVFFKHLLHKI